MSERRIVLVRHGVTDWNREGRFQGHQDPPLGEAGIREASLAAARIVADARLRPARVVASSLARAFDTGRAIATAAGVDVDPEPRLMEIGQGEWEGRTHAELEVADADRYREWRRAAGIRQPPGGETIAAATRRVKSLLDEIESSHAWPLCLVSHGGTLRILAHVLLSLGGGRSRALDVDNASISVATRYAGGWRLERWNDTLHLLGLEPTHVDEAEGRPLAL
ncbi:MAG TPA: histidine phosphatase family protein [Candidatus Binatia bacterium]|nr:histidine phosphatase family protein [Candidatus Binatia bacterium]